MTGYGTDNGFQTWLTDNGLTAPSGSVPAARNRGSLFIDSYEPRFVGHRTAGYDQERAWPRTNATTYYGDTVPDSTIPNAVLTASYYAAYQELQSPGSLAPVIIGTDIVKREKVGQLEVEYAVGSGSAEEIAASAKPCMTMIDGLLWPFLFAQNMPAALVV